MKQENTTCFRSKSVNIWVWLPLKENIQVFVFKFFLLKIFAFVQFGCNLHLSDYSMSQLIKKRPWQKQTWIMYVVLFIFVTGILKNVSCGFQSNFVKSGSSVMEFTFKRHIERKKRMHLQCLIVLSASKLIC